MAPSESQASLRRALRTLRAIRQRYAIGREAHPVARFYTIQVGLGCGDMLWLSAVIETVERAIAGAATEATGAADQASPPNACAVSAAHLAAVVSRSPATRQRSSGTPSGASPKPELPEGL